MACNPIQKRDTFSFGCYSEIEGKICYTQATGEKVALKEANPKTVLVIGNKTPGYTCLNKDIWLKDEMNVYYKGKLLIGADVNTFKVLSLGFSKDKNHVFFQGKKLKNTNAESFRTLTGFFAKDKKQVYYKDKVISRILDVEGFEVIDGFIVRDSQNIYTINKTAIKFFKKDLEHKFDVFKTVQNTIGKYYSDGKNIYYLDAESNKISKIQFANCSKFKVLDKMHYATDSLYVFYKDKIISGLKPQELELLGNNYSKNKKTVFYKNKKVYQANPLNFKIDNAHEGFDATDSLNCFFEGSKVDTSLVIKK